MNGTEYAKENILQSIENCISYASYISGGYSDEFPLNDLRYELEEMIERFKKRVEKKFKDYENYIRSRNVEGVEK